MRPEKEALAALSAVIKHDIEAITRLDGDVEAMTDTLGSVTCEFRDLAGAAYLLHNIYNALENSFAQISRTFENHITDRMRWHGELLDKMFLEIPTVRPAVLPESSRRALNDLRGFRHVFRHSYDLELDRERLAAVAQGWRREKAAVLKALGDFKDFLLRQAQLDGRATP